MTAKEMLHVIGSFCQIKLPVNGTNVVLIGTVNDIRKVYNRIDYEVLIDQTDKAHDIDVQSFWISEDRILKVYSKEETFQFRKGVSELRSYYYSQLMQEETCQPKKPLKS